MESGITKCQPLGGGKIIYTTDEYRFGTDAIILAAFSKPKPNFNICDLGCGGGIIPLLFCRDGLGKEVIGVDIQKDACALAESAAKENGFLNMRVINADLRQLKGVLPFGHFDLVTCNPPYTKSDGGIKNPNAARRIARFEDECTLDDVCSAAAKLLKSGGKFTVCQRPERLGDIFATMRKNGIEPKYLRTVHQRFGKEAWLILCEGKRGAQVGLRVLPPLYIEDEKGNFSEEMTKIYGMYRYGE